MNTILLFVGGKDTTREVFEELNSSVLLETPVCALTLSVLQQRAH